MLKEQTESYKTIIREHLPRKKNVFFGTERWVKKKNKNNTNGGEWFNLNTFYSKAILS